MASNATLTITTRGFGSAKSIDHRRIRMSRRSNSGTTRKWLRRRPAMRFRTWTRNSAASMRTCSLRKKKMVKREVSRRKKARARARKSPRQKMRKLTRQCQDRRRSPRRSGPLSKARTPSRASKRSYRRWRASLNWIWRQRRKSRNSSRRSWKTKQGILNSSIGGIKMVRWWWVAWYRTFLVRLSVAVAVIDRSSRFLFLS